MRLTCTDGQQISAGAYLGQIEHWQQAHFGAFGPAAPQEHLHPVLIPAHVLFLLFRPNYSRVFNTEPKARSGKKKLWRLFVVFCRLTRHPVRYSSARVSLSLQGKIGTHQLSFKGDCGQRPESASAWQESLSKVMVPLMPPKCVAVLERQKDCAA